MAYQLFGVSAEQNIGDTAIVMFSHLGSNVESDTGGDAAYIADALRLPVLAVDRPYDLKPLHGNRPSMHQVELLDQQLREGALDALAANGITRVILFGRSAGGLGALTAARTAALSDLICAVHVQDPIGWFDVTVRQGRKIFKAYQKHQRQRIDDVNDQELVRAEHTHLGRITKIQRMFGNLARSLLDIYSNQYVWSTSAARRHAEAIAATRPDVTLDIRFAEDTYVLGDQQPEHLQEILLKLRAATESDIAQPINVQAVPNTVHASFDRRPFSALHLAEVVTRAMAGEAPKDRPLEPTAGQ